MIPLEELRSIRSDAPPAVVRQPEARRLLTRSAIVGYGKPIGGAVLAALFAVGFVVVGATERVWRTVDSPNHWDALSWKGSRGSVYAQRTSLASDPNKPRVIVGGSSRFFGEDSPGLTVWDAHDGRLIGAISRQNLSIAGGRIWDYDNQTGRLIGLDATGKETSSVATPDDGRPPGRMRVGDFDKPNIVSFEGPSSGLVHIWLDLTHKKWSIVAQKSMLPESDPTSFSMRGTSARSLVAYVADSKVSSRLTVWSIGSERPVFDRIFNRKDFRLLGLSEAGDHFYLSFIHDGNVEVVLIKVAAGQGGEPSEAFSVETSSPLAIPKDFPAWDDEYLFKGERKSPAVLNAGNRVVVVEPRQTRTVFWIFDPALGRFDDPEFGAQVVRMQSGGYAWSPEGSAGTLRIWLEGETAPFQLQGPQIHHTDKLLLSEDRQRMLIVSEDGGAELWSVDLSKGTASRSAKIPAPRNASIRFNDDGRFVFVRELSASYAVWDRDGTLLGSLGVLGNAVQSSTYRPECQQILLWTSAGERLDLRRGYNIPLYGFLQARDCSEQKSWMRQFLDAILP